MGEQEVKRALRVNFSARGQKKLEQDTREVGKSLIKAGSEGTKALGGVDKTIQAVGESMKRTLDPIDKGFEGFRKIQAIMGGFGMVGSLAAGAFALVSKALVNSELAAAQAEARMKALKEEQEELTAAVLRYAGALTLAQVKELQSAKGRVEGIQAVQSMAAGLEAQSSRRIDATRREIEELQGREAVLRAALLFEKETTVQGARHAQILEKTTTRLKGLRETLESATNAQATHTKAFDSANPVIRDATIALKEHEAQAQALYDKTYPRAEAALKSFAAVKGEVTADEMALDREAEAARKAIAAARQADWNREVAMMFQVAKDRARLAKVWADAEVEGARRAQEYLDDLVPSYEANTSAAQVYGEQLAANAAAVSVIAALEGESVKDALGNYMRAKRDEAIVSGLESVAMALGAGGTFLLTGSPAAAAAAKQYALQAAAWGAVAAATGLGAGALGSSAGSGGGGGGGSQSMTGRESGGGSGEVVVNINFSGPAGGMGQVLARELNAEAQRQGGARLDSRIVRR